MQVEGKFSKLTEIPKNVGHLIPPGVTQNEQQYKNFGGYDKWTDVFFQFILLHDANTMCELGQEHNILLIHNEQKCKDAKFQGLR